MRYLLIIVLLLVFLYYSEFNTKKVKFQGTDYNVHVTSDDSSAKVLAEMEKRVEVLKKHLLEKYGCEGCGEMFGKNFIGGGKRNFIADMHARTEQLVANYDPNNIYEISPNNLMGNTSFTQNKSKLIMCLRSKETGKVHDINTLMFVNLHELTHMMNDEWGHELQFWQLFKIVLENAVECGIYKPVDYSKTPQRYCGMDIIQSPLYEPLLD